MIDLARGILKTSLQVFWLKVWELFKNVLACQAGDEQIEHV
jgi:hypothetical protein